MCGYFMCVNVNTTDVWRSACKQCFPTIVDDFCMEITTFICVRVLIAASYCCCFLFSQSLNHSFVHEAEEEINAGFSFSVDTIFRFFVKTTQIWRASHGAHVYVCVWKCVTRDENLFKHLNGRKERKWNEKKNKTGKSLEITNCKKSTTKDERKINLWKKLQIGKCVNIYMFAYI